MKRDHSDDLKPSSESLRTQRRIKRLARLPAAASRFLDFLGSVFLSTIWRFVRKWSASRPRGAFARGLPAALAAVSILVLAAVVLQQVSGGNTVGRYRQSAADALRRRDLQTASLWVEKMTQYGAPSAAYEFRLGLLAAEQGDHRKALEIMRRLAPRERAGYADAHYWLARDLIRQNRPLPVELAEIVENHLRQSLRGESVRDMAQALLGQLYLAQGDWEGAEEYLQEAARQRPELYMTLSKLHRSLDDPIRAREAARRGAERFREMAQSEPDRWEHRVQWAQCELLADDYSTAIRILVPLLNDTDADDSIRETLAVAYLGMFNQAVTKAPENVGKQLQLLDRALLFDPTNTGALQLLVQITSSETEGSHVRLIRDSLRPLLASGMAPSVVHLILGVQHLDNGLVDRAGVHLELAQKSNPKIPFVLNGLAQELTHREAPDLPRALSLVDAATRLDDDPRIRGTRAIVLGRLGRPADAAAELESILAMHPAPSWVHSQLADLYRQQGDVARADEHDRLAKAVDEEASPPGSN